jgi:hypothetical protein
MFYCWCPMTMLKSLVIYDKQYNCISVEIHVSLWQVFHEIIYSSKWQTCISFLDTQMATVRSPEIHRGYFEHLLLNFCSECIMKLWHIIRNLWKEKRAVTLKGGFSGTMLIWTFFSFNLVCRTHPYICSRT